MERIKLSNITKNYRDRKIFEIAKKVRFNIKKIYIYSK